MNKHFSIKLKMLEDDLYLVNGQIGEVTRRMSGVAVIVDKFLELAPLLVALQENLFQLEGDLTRLRREEIQEKKDG